ncbi:O-antigen ligase family protein [Sphingomonadaceae bacterium]|nr:O-antigen ligase family protein [Sphingomonadaceae bacterium]
MVGLCLLAASAAFLGGSSRYDSGQLIALQPIAWLLTGYFLLRITKADLTENKWPVLLLAGLTLTMVLQLIPLPASLWTQLPGRGVVSDLDAALGPIPMRPISLMPSRTIHALANLAVPIAGLLAFIALKTHRIKVMTITILALGGINALVALIQFVGPGGEWLYFYRGKNGGVAAGLFANQNHASVFGAVMMVFIAAIISKLQFKEARSQIIILFGLYAFIFMMSLMSGSRAGLMTCALALAATSIILLKPRRNSSAAPNKAAKRFSPAGVITALIGIALVALFVFSERLPAFDEFIAKDPLEDSRFAFMPVLREMIVTYFPFGTGFGSFENVYYIHEPDALLMPSYLNMAHNDWFQTIIEAGVIGAGLLVAASWWIGSIAARLFRMGEIQTAIALIAGIAVAGIASYFDYPLRAPLFQLAGLWLLLIAHEHLKTVQARISQNGVSLRTVAS